MLDSYSANPTSQDAWRLVGHFLHLRCHQDPHWRRVDHRAAVLAEELAMLPVQRGQDVTVAMWLPLTTSVSVECADPGCVARQMYLASDGSGVQPASGPLPAFIQNGALAYFTYTTHPHGQCWAASIDPQTVHWMTTALALYGGYLQVDFTDSQPDTLAMGHTLWSVDGAEATVLSRHETVACDAGVTEIHPVASKRISVYPPVPPELRAERGRSRPEAGR